MKLHTLDEILYDIQKFENITVRTNDDYKNARFLKLYSEVFSTPLNDGKTSADVFERLYEFINTENVTLPECDKFPNKEFVFWVYKMNFCENGIIDICKPMTLMLTTNDENEAVHQASVDSNPQILIVDTSSEKLTCFVRMTTKINTF